MNRKHTLLTSVAFVASCLLPFSTAVNPCAPKEEQRCIPSRGSCGENPNACCDGLGCFGYNFFKRCQPPPTCLSEWYDCSSGMTCCGELVCAITDAGLYECQRRTVTTRVVDVVTEPKKTLAPTAAPTRPKDTTTTTIPGQPVRTKVGCTVGDPHIYTFDGLAHDCQAEGEYILVKSKVTRRQIQARYAHFADFFSPGNAWSVTRGVVIQDEGDTPKVQLSIPILESSFTPNTLGPDNCKIQFFVDGVQRDLKDGSGKDDKVLVTMDNQEIRVKYVHSEMMVTVSTGNANGCFINVCVFLPETDKTIGLLGSANGNTADDWTDRSGKVIPVPESLTSRMGKEGYDYCTKNWCLRDPADSLFTYPENGIDFYDIMHCDLPYGDTLVDYINNVNKTIADFCNNELVCMIDAQMGGLDAANSTKTHRTSISQTCNNEGGECNVASCCTGLKCIQINAFAKECRKEDPRCAGEWANCATSGCCGDLVCTELNDGSKQCRDIPDCMPEWRDCSEIGCCDDMKCVKNSDGRKQCRALPSCMPEWQDCSLGVDCCNGLTCVTDPNTSVKQCRNIPKCYAEEWRDCSSIPCCDGLTCIPSDGRQVCRELPQCVAEWQSCDYVGCCQDGPKPLKCVQNGSSKQCQPACTYYDNCSATNPCCDNTKTCKSPDWAPNGPPVCL